MINWRDYEFDGYTVRWIRNWLDGPIQRVTVNDSMLKWKPIIIGVPQSPYGYQSYFASSLIAQTNGIECTLIKFLDNNKMNGIADISEGKGIIQVDLNRLEDWDCTNLMNIHKTSARSCTWVMSNSNISTDWRRNVLRPVQRRRTWCLPPMWMKKLDVIQQCVLAA